MTSGFAALCLLVCLTASLGLVELNGLQKRLLLTGTDILQQQYHSLQLEIQEMKTKYSQQESTITQLNIKFQSQEATISQLSNKMSKIAKESGSVYIRWGKKTCPSNATLVYSGYTAGTEFTVKGSSASSICLPQDPIWSSQEPSHYEYVAKLYGSEYQFDLLSQHLVNNDVPCAVCMSRPGSEVLMIPGRNRCYADWNEEYSGYLIGAYQNYSSEDFLCLDGHPGVIYGGAADQNGRLFYFTVTKCGSLQCPPYENNKVVTCVVCSK